MESIQVNGVEFRIGDTVRVMRRFDTFEQDGMGKGVASKCAWNGKLLDTIGKEGTVLHIKPGWISVNFDQPEIADWWNYPATALENLRDKERKQAPTNPVKLRPFMRVITRNRERFIVVPRGSERISKTPLILLDKKNAYMEAIYSRPAEQEFDIVEVWSAPEQGYRMFDHDFLGRRLWAEDDARRKAERQKKLAELKKQQEILINEISALEKEV